MRDFIQDVRYVFQRAQCASHLLNQTLVGPAIEHQDWQYSGVLTILATLILEKLRRTRAGILARTRRIRSPPAPARIRPAAKPGALWFFAATNCTGAQEECKDEPTSSQSLPLSVERYAPQLDIETPNPDHDLLRDDGASSGLHGLLRDDGASSGLHGLLRDGGGSSGLHGLLRDDGASSGLTAHTPTVNLDSTANAPTVIPDPTENVPTVILDVETPNPDHPDPDQDTSQMPL